MVECLGDSASVSEWGSSERNLLLQPALTWNCKEEHSGKCNLNLTKLTLCRLLQQVGLGLGNHSGDVIVVGVHSDLV